MIRMKPRRGGLLYLLALLLMPTGCTAAADPDPAREWDATVVARYPHDPDAFTQGLEFHDGRLYEGTGGYGRSWITISDLESGEVRQRSALPDEWFGEGVTVTPAGIWQLTWRNHIALLRDPASLTVKRRARFDGEGWGICHQSSKDRLVMSDGTATLTFRDPSTFAEVGEVTVTLDGRRLDQLNELECVGSAVWANVWKHDHIVRIDLETGRVTDVVQVGRRHDAGVLNGIAAVPGSDDLLVTGKNWPTLYRIRPGGP